MYVYLSLSDSPFLLSLFYLCRSHFLCLPLARSHAKWRCYPTGRCNFRLSVTCDWWERERKESDRPSFTIDCQTPLSLSLSPPRNSFNHAEGAPSQVKQHPRRFSGDSADSSIHRGLADCSIRRGLAHSRSRPQKYVAQQRPQSQSTASRGKTAWLCSHRLCSHTQVL